MNPKELVKKWVEVFNEQDANLIAELYQKSELVLISTYFSSHTQM